jgi:hypothetical protein
LLGRYGSAAQQYRAAIQADPSFVNPRSRLTGAEVRASGTTTGGAGSRRSTSSATGNRAAEMAAGNVNPSYADINAGGAAGAVAVGALPSLSPVQRGLLVTLTILIQPIP